MAGEISGKTDAPKGVPRGKPFVKGKSGNPGGRPRTLRDFQEAVRERCTPKALAALEKLLVSKSPAARARAVDLAFSYGWGKPMQAVEISGPEGKPLEAQLKAEVAYDAQRIVRIAELVAQVKAQSLDGGAGGTAAPADAEVDEVHPASPSPDPGGIPPPR